MEPQNDPTSGPKKTTSHERFSMGVVPVESLPQIESFSTYKKNRPKIGISGDLDIRDSPGAPKKHSQKVGKFFERCLFGTMLVESLLGTLEKIFFQLPAQLTELRSNPAKNRLPGLKKIHLKS
jgi:hypothetical protein